MAAAASVEGRLSQTKRRYGELNGKEITAFTLTNDSPNGIEVEVINYGAIITGVIQPDRRGVKGNVVLGYERLESWVSGKPWSGGATDEFNSVIGRHANRIKEGKFTLDGETYQLEKNNNGHHLHGGAAGFNAKIWTASEIHGKDGDRSYVGVLMEYLSPDGEDGYPGELQNQMIFKLYGDNTLQMEFHSEVKDKPTIVSLCNHAYWNLHGEDSASSTILDHELRLNAESITEPDPNGSLLPTGRIIPIADTPFDFLKQRTIGSRIEELNKTIPAPGGYDNNYVLNKDFIETAEPLILPHEVSPGLRASFAARLSDPRSGRVMDVYTTAPGIQCYTGNFLDGQSLVGRGGVAYPKHGAVCLETQTFPDYLTHREAFKNYPGPILRPGEKKIHITQHIFSTQS